MTVDRSKRGKRAAAASRPTDGHDPAKGFYRDGTPHRTAHELREYAEMMKGARK